MKKLKILIIMPRIRSDVNAAYSFALGIPYISSVLKSNGFTVLTLNLNSYENATEVIIRTIKSNQINVVMSGGLSPQFREVKSIFDTAKSFDRKIITICGGGLISGDPLAAMEAIETVDYGVIGEGEVTICELCRSLETNYNQRNIPGIVLKKDCEFITTSKRMAIDDISSIPWPDYDGFYYNDYLESSNICVNGINYKRVATILTSRSCPYSCTFCFHTIGNRYRLRDIDDVFGEIDFQISKYKVEFLLLQDELFALSLKRVKAFCQRIKKYNIPWYVPLRAEQVTDELLTILKEANCISIFIGSESADNSILKSMKKKTTIEEIEVATEKIKSIGIEVTSCFIFGDVNETFESAKNTLNWWQEHSEYNFGLAPIKLYPGTQLYRHAIENNLINDPVQFHKDNCPITNVSKMSDDELGKIMEEITFIAYRCGSRINKGEIVNQQSHIYTIRGECSHCQSNNTWDNVIFFSANRLSCPNCRTQLVCDLPSLVIKTIDNNLNIILNNAENGIVLWGMAQFASSFLDKTSMINNDRIFLVDSSAEKQLMTIKETRVYSPQIIRSKNIKTIIILIPDYIETIRLQHNGLNTLSINEILDPLFEYSV
jgi:anaerobic magnesium-protoporphyrin IX monomethyl ester cyclase